MADTEKTYNSTGSTTYTFEFEYLKPNDVKVSVAGVDTSEFTIPSSAPTTIQFNNGHVPDNNAGVIRIYRDTDVDNLEATFYAGSAIKSQDLNDNFNQNLFVTQEAKRDIATAWQDGDETVNSTETWYTTDDTKIATTKAIQERLVLKQNADTNLTNLSNCQTGGSGALAALTQTEIEILDGATVSTTELNYVDGVTSAIQTQLDAKQDEDALLTAISGKSFRTSTDGLLTATDDDEIPSSKVVANHVTSSLSAIGGFIAIANEDIFPNTQPANGVIVSINDAHGITVNSSLTSTSGDCTTVNGTAVTIEGFKSGLQGALPEGNGLIVTSTGADNKYNYHKLLATEADVLQLSDDINDFHSRYRVAASAPASNNDDGDLYWDTSTTDTRKMKVYDSNSSTPGWIDLVTTGETFINDLTASDASAEDGGSSATFNGTAYRFTLTNHPTGVTAAHHIVSRAGVIQKPNTGTSQPSEGFAIDGHDIIFDSAPTSGTNVFVTTLGSALSIGTPADNSVSMAKINATGTASSSTFLRGDGAWEPAAGTITATASGAIAANKPVAVKTGGLISQIGANTEVTGTISSITTDTTFTGNPKIVYDPDTEKVVIFYVRELTADRGLFYKVGTISSNNTISFGDEKTAVSSGINGGAIQLAACYSTVHNKFVIAYVLDDSGAKNLHFKAGSISNNEITWGSEAEPVAAANGDVNTGGSGGSEKIKLVADDDNGTVACIYKKKVTVNSTLTIRVYATGMVTSSQNNDLTINSNSSDSYMWLGSSSGDGALNGGTVQDLVYDTNNNSYIGLVDKNDQSSGTPDGRSAVFDFTVDSTGKIDPTDYLATKSLTDIDTVNTVQGAKLAYDPDEEVFLVAYGKDSDLKVHVRALTFNGSTFTVGNELTSTSSNEQDLPDEQETTYLYFDSYTKDFGFSYKLESGSAHRQRLVSFTVASGTTTVTETVADRQIGSSTDNYFNGGSIIIPGTTNTNPSKIAYGYRPTTNTIKLYILTPETKHLETASAFVIKFIGFSAAAISNNATGKINVVGNTTTQSGLTVGSKYYVNTDGTLSTTAGTPEVLAGTALSATELLIGAGELHTTYSTFNTTTDGLVPKADTTGDTDKFLKGNGNWAVPTNTTYSDFSETVDGLVPAPTSSNTTKFLKGNSTWAVPTNTTYDEFTTSADGLVPKANTTGDTSKFLKGNATWGHPMTLITSVTFSNSAWTEEQVDLGTNWWNTYKSIKLIIWATYQRNNYQTEGNAMYFKYNNDTSTDGSTYLDADGIKSGGTLWYSSGTAQLGYFKNDGDKNFLECDIYSDGSSTVFLSQMMGKSEQQAGVIRSIFDTASSDFRFYTLEDGSNNRFYFTGTAKFYGIN